jgi:hypothetical protein
MYRACRTFACLLLLCVLGCGKSKPTQGERELTEQQNKAQSAVDDEERQWQQKQQK